MADPGTIKATLIGGPSAGLGFAGAKKLGKMMTPDIGDAPSYGSASVQQAAMAEIARRNRAKGYRSTVLSSYMPSRPGIRGPEQ